MPPATNAGKSLTTDMIYTLEDVNVDHLEQPKQDRVRIMLPRCRGKVDMTKPEIEVSKCTKSQISQPYRARQRAGRPRSQSLAEIRSHRTISIRMG